MSKQLRIFSLPALQPVATLSDDRSWVRRQGKAHRRFQEKLRRIRSASSRGRRTQPLVRDFLRCPDAKLSAALRSIGENPEEDLSIALGRSINSWSMLVEKVQWYPKRKPDGGWRPICKLSPELFARHKLIQFAIHSQLHPVPGLFGIPGQDRSRDDCVRLFRSFIKSGFTHLAEVDVKNCFQSFNLDALYELPLPKEVIKHNLDTRNLNYVRVDRYLSYTDKIPYGVDTIANSSGPTGLMQGSPASNIIFAWFMNGVLRDLPEQGDVKVVLCFDNIFVAGRTPDSLRVMLDTLTETLSRCSFGPLEFSNAQIAHDGDLDLMSYLVRNNGQIGISERALARLESRLGSAEELDALRPAWLPFRSWATLRAFSTGFSAVDDIASELELYIENSAQLLDGAESPMLSHLHTSLLSSNATVEGKVIDWLLRRALISEH